MRKLPYSVALFIGAVAFLLDAATICLVLLVALGVK
jgi:hypothetical protein